MCVWRRWGGGSLTKTAPRVRRLVGGYASNGGGKNYPSPEESDANDGAGGNKYHILLKK